MAEPTPPPPSLPSPDGPRFSAGAVIATAFRLALRHAGPFLLVTLLLFAPAMAVDAARSSEIGNGLSMLLWALLRAFAVASITRGTLDALGGEEPGVGRMLLGGAARGLRLLAVGILSGLITGLGLVALVVPGLLAAAGLLVCEPAAVAEPATTASVSLSRSWALTRGHRWGSLGVLLVFQLLALAIPLGVAALAGGFSEEGLSRPVELVVNVLQAAAIGLQAIAAAVAYHALRTEKEGSALPRLAQVFE